MLHRHYTYIRKWALCLLGFCWTLSLAAQPLVQRLERCISTSSLLNTSELGFVVFDLTEGKYIYRHQDKKLYRPASVEKIITSVTALAELRENYCFKTYLGYTGYLSPDSVLYGNLYVKGGFDPEFTFEDMNQFTQAVNNLGIRSISGSLIGDISMKDSLYWGAGWSWDDTPAAFQPYLSPLMLNRGCVDIDVYPSVPGTSPQVKVYPISDYYTVSNQAISHAPHAGKARITRNWLHHQNQIQISGNVTQPVKHTLNMYDSSRFFLSTFRYALQQAGVMVSSLSFASMPDTAICLDSVVRPLNPVIQRALKKSDNLSAEALFYHLGYAQSDSLPVGSEEAKRVINRFMKSKIGRLPAHYSIADGSGVSLYNYISPDLLMEYLKYAYYHADIFSSFYEALPVAGVDGTLHYRMKKGKAFRNVRAKTGTVTGVSSLAGYVHAANGHTLAFVIINQNILKGRAARAFQDRICEILAS